MVLEWEVVGWVEVVSEETGLGEAGWEPEGRLEPTPRLHAHARFAGL